MFMDRIRFGTIALGVFALLTTGCSRTDNTDLNYKTAINDHFGSRTPRPLRGDCIARGKGQALDMELRVAAYSTLVKKQ